MNIFARYIGRTGGAALGCLILLTSSVLAAESSTSFEGVNDVPPADTFSVSMIAIMLGIALVISMLVVVGYHMTASKAGSVAILQQRQKGMEEKISQLVTGHSTDDMQQIHRELHQLKQENAELREAIKRLAYSAESTAKNRRPETGLQASSTASVRGTETMPMKDVRQLLNSDGLLPAEVNMIQAFLKDYHNTYMSTPATPRQKKQLKESFMAQYELKGFSCCNGEVVTGAKANPEFALVNDDPEFYALPVKENIYAVVPALWRTWLGLQVNLFGMKELFNVHGTDDSSYKVSVSKEALCQLQGTKLQLKRAGQASLKEA